MKAGPTDLGRQMRFPGEETESLSLQLSIPAQQHLEDQVTLDHPDLEIKVTLVPQEPENK